MRANNKKNAGKRSVISWEFCFFRVLSLSVSKEEEEEEEEEGRVQGIRYSS